jgi:hypothetical protein
MSALRILVLSLVALGALAQEPQPPAEASEPQKDERIELLRQDLYATARIVELSKSLGDDQDLLLAILDDDIDRLRIRREDGSYEWASLQREEGGKTADEKTIERVHTEAELREVTITAPNAYRLVVSVPQKRGLLAGNNRVYIRNVIVDSTAFDGKTSHQEIPVNSWVNPGDAHGVALPDIGKSVKATAELGVESGGKQARAEVALIQAKLVDNPASPYFPAVQKLLAIRDFADEKEINRGHVKNAVDEALLALPGELEKRVAAQEEAERVRLQMAAAGTTTGTIALGDATPDVVAELEAIARLLTGTLTEQAEGRARLDVLMTALKPPAVE